MRGAATRHTWTRSSTQSRASGGGDIYGLARPPETYRRSPIDREARRRCSQWEVRVAKYRNVPPPPDPRNWYH
ncbi:hypothetical protein [Micromonospora sp. NPDC051296]|uniref:hypothetical protein n=1 Tax=Micromonospora sp. NPDC051296 TaxID=3155046 RepID=UPI00341BB347